MSDPRTQILDRYRTLLNDDDFERIEIGLKAPNIFSILGVSRTEIRHSNFLGWLLDPNGSHGLGKLFLNRFLRDVAARSERKDLDEIRVEELNYDDVEIRREWRHIDLLVIFQDLVVCIENKVDSSDHSDQLNTYADVVKASFPGHHRVFVYLTPDGDRPNDEARVPYALCSYRDIIVFIDRVLSVHGASMNEAAFRYIKDYSVTLKRELTKTDELNQLAKQIFKNHEELFRFILEHGTDVESDMMPVFRDKFKDWGYVPASENKGFARFLTPALEDVIPRKGVGLPGKESFAFEVDFYGKKKKAKFKALIAPSDESVHRLLAKALSEVPGAKQPQGEKWLIHFDHTWDFDKEVIGNDAIEINQILDKQREAIKEIVEKVEAGILNYEKELRSMK
jgi:hypothetical protein